MRFKKISLMFEYTAWFLKRYGDQQQIQQNIYRVVEVKQSSLDQYKLAIQIIGKSTVVECTPQEIVANDRMLEGFSKKDIRAITYFACEQSKKPKYKIIMQEFCDTFNKILFKLKKYDSDEIILKTAGQISLDKHFINNLSQEDACSISYAAGYEQSSHEKCANSIGENKAQNNEGGTSL
ncbi:MAG: hypothetical protein A3F11_06810 [Gammaproteobacteria bacterium RIFCSPHIGHO2_12_FULL_37_14]|nr:MAG: hypothetical protein A3F11_06810 [Gammaproteobacteria bacterium RIFCSPHIGHO2_12_FULL_37_14]